MERDIFRGENILEFSERFKDNESCLKYLAEIKWETSYTCKRCGQTHYSIRKGDYARQCHHCHYTESPTANTLFHKVKFGIRKAFMIVFEMSATTKSLSATQMSKRYGISRQAAWAFMHKVRQGMKSSGTAPMEGIVQVDEFVVGGKENLKQGRSRDTKKKKIVCAVELTEDQKVKRVYAMKIEDYSSKSLKTIFDGHISKHSKVRTDEWSGYSPLTKEFNIEQIESMNSANFKQLHHIVHQIKTWLRTIFSWVHSKHINRYLDEYCFRINRSIYKQTIFDKLIGRMINSQPFTYQDIIISV